MKHLIRTLCAYTGILVAIPSAANAAGLGIEANVAHTQDTTGAEIGVGYAITAGRFDLTPSIGAFLYKGDSGGYFETTDRNGTKRCRASNGQFASKSRCNSVAADAYARAEIGVTFSQVRVGAGARYMDYDSGSDFKPYGTLSYMLSPRFMLKANAGDDYYAVGLNAGF